MQTYMFNLLHGERVEGINRFGTSSDILIHCTPELEFNKIYLEVN